MDQVMPLGGQRYLGPVVFDIVWAAENLDVLLLPVAADDAQQAQAIQSAEWVCIRSVDPLYLQLGGVVLGDALQSASVQHIARDRAEEQPVRNVGQAAHLREVLPDYFSGGLVDCRPESFLGALGRRDLRDLAADQHKVARPI